MNNNQFFVQLESFISSLLIICGASFAVLLCNIECCSVLYKKIVAFKIFCISFKDFVLEGLMSVFFLFVVLELKKSFQEGIFPSKYYICVSAVAALGGMLVPIGIFCLFNIQDPHALKGFAIPCATDIAFAVGIYNLVARASFGNRAKLLLLAISIFDDVGAILLIAFFYVGHISYGYLLFGIFAIILLIVCNQRGINNLLPYFISFFTLWYSAKMSGIEPTISGVITGIFIPAGQKYSKNLLDALIKYLNLIVNLLILPIFAFVTCGIKVPLMSLSLLCNKQILGIFLGLFLGKQIGIVLFTRLMFLVKTIRKNIVLPIKELYLVSILGGIGFTMSLFISNLSFAKNSYMTHCAKLGLILASLSSILLSVIFCYINKIQCSRAKR